MKKPVKLVFAAALAVGALSIASSAQTRKPFHNINQRQQNQQQRISGGIQSGELTAREAARLERRQVQTQRLEQRYRDSGDRLTLRERLRLENRLNRTSYQIYRQKHDRQDTNKP